MKTLDKNSEDFKKKRNLFYSIAERNAFRIECGILIDNKKSKLKLNVKFATQELLDFVTTLLKDMNTFCTLPDGHKETQTTINNNIHLELERWYEYLGCTFDKKFIKLF